MKIIYIGGYQSFLRADQALDTAFYRSDQVGDPSISFSDVKHSIVILSTSFVLKDPKISLVRLMQKVDHLTTNIIQRLEPKGLIYVSSAAVYGLRESSQGIKEDSDLAGATIYAQEKILFEQKMVKLSVGKFDLVVVRPSAFVGRFKESNPSLVDKCILSLANKTEPKLKIELGGLQMRDFCDWNDYVEAIRLLTVRLKNKQSKEKKECLKLNLSSLQPICIRNLLRNFGIKFELSDVPSGSKIHLVLNTELAIELEVMPKKRQIADWIETLRCF